MMSELVTRFFRYVEMDTQSKDGVTDRYPSTENQKVLGALLVAELKELGLEDAQMDTCGYVTASLPGNLSAEAAARVPVIGFLAHLDTSPDVSGSGVVPVIHYNYRGGDIILPGDPRQVIGPDRNPELLRHIGEDIITSDGTTLLGADDKAGIAEIMTMLAFLQQHPDIPRGSLKIAFTPDEEVGSGTKYFDVEKFGAHAAYTVDGGGTGRIENETFNASTAVIDIRGITVHPGQAMGHMVNAVKIAADLLNEMRSDPAPETTEKRQGFVHPYMISGGAGEVRLKFLLRDFETEGIVEKTQRLEAICRMLRKRYSRAAIDLCVTESYKNMRLILEKYPEITYYALEAAARAGTPAEPGIIRGGTDGARLSFQGLPTPNIFTGGYNFHSPQEWISIQAMEAAVRTLVELVQIWAEKGSGSLIAGEI